MKPAPSPAPHDRVAPEPAPHPNPKLDRIAAQIAADARKDPARYLRDAKVPGGGE